MDEPQRTSARRRRKRDERRRPTQRAVSPAGDGATSSPGPRRQLAGSLAPRSVSRARDPCRGRGARRRAAGDPAPMGGRGLIPQYDGEWTRAAIGTARVVARMRERGHSQADIARATRRAGSPLAFSRSCSRPSASASQCARPRARRAWTMRWSSGWSPALGISSEQADSVYRGRGPAAALRRRRCSPPGSRSWRCCSSCASTVRRWPGSLTPRCACFTSTSTSR